MEKTTKLIIAAVGLGGLGFFLYKKGLFGTKKITQVDKKVKPKVVVQPVGDSIPPVSVFVPEPVYVPIWAETEIYPVDVVYPQEGKLVKKPVDDFFVVNTYDKLPVNPETGYYDNYRIDYGTGKYNQDVTYEYAEKDLNNIRFNKLLYV